MTTPQKLASLFDWDNSPRQIVAFQGNQPLHFEELKRDIRRVHAALPKFHTAVLLCEDSYNFLVGFFSLLAAGAHIRIPSGLAPVAAASLVAANSHREALKKSVVSIGDAEILALGTSTKPGERPPTLDHNALQLDLFTSGTTGEPGRIRKSLAMLDHEIASLHQSFGDRDIGTPVFATVSHQHMYGLIFKVLWPLTTSRPFVAEHHKLWEPLLASLSFGSALVTSPAHLSRMDGLKALETGKRPSLVLSAGAPLPFASSGMARDILGVTPTEIFGSTETGAIARRSRLSDREPWNPLPGVRIESVDGKLRALSPAGGPDWIETGDLIELRGQAFELRGRLDRVTKIEGKRVDLGAVEEALEKLSLIRHAAVVLAKAPVERLVAAVVLSEEGQRNLKHLGKFRFGRFLRTELQRSEEGAAVPRGWRFVDSLPAKDMGKRRESDILSLFEAA